MRSIVDRPALLLGLGATLAVVAFHLWITPSNPPGYHRDESALSLNAYTLSTSLRDEDGARLPLFFRSFEDYKSPVYSYKYVEEGTRRTGRFEAAVPGLLDQAWANGGTVYIDYDDREPQGLARWYALERGIDQSRVVRPPDGGIPPVGSIAFGREQECDYTCVRITESGDYWIARVEGPRGWRAV